MDKKLVNQKEYLKKYLSSGKDKKKVKKKKLNLGTKTVKIIDDDIDLKNMRALEDGELDIYNNTEDGPQIAGIVDERGPVDFSDKKRWKIVTDDWEGDITVTRVNRDGRIADEESSTGDKKPDSESRDQDFSPPRRPRKNSDSDDAPKKKSSKKHRSKASSPGRNRSDPQDSDCSPPRESRKGSDSDEPPRKKSPSKKRRSKAENRSDPDDSDLSPPRKVRKDSDSDLSPPRNSKLRGKEKDGRYNSSSRKKDKSKHSQRREDPRGSRHGDYDDNRNPRARSSASPAPRGRNESHKTGKQSNRNNFDERDDRRNNRARQERKRVSRWKDRSPSPQNRGKDNGERRSKTHSQKGEKGSDSDLSPPRENRQNLNSNLPQNTTSTNYQEMNEETTGFGQAPVYRDRKTGRRRDFAAEAREQGEKDEKRQELEEKYAQWGRGLKQVEDRQEKLDRDLYEMSKPLARYADDADLERELKAQDREGDPMLAYMRRKQVKEGKQEPEMPKYRGPSMPNRFGIRPGYRWDGVDRSNGYEKKWFEAQNARKAVQEEAYKWSTADM